MPDKGRVVHFGKVDAVQDVGKNSNFVASAQGNSEEARLPFPNFGR